MYKEIEAELSKMLEINERLIWVMFVDDKWGIALTVLFGLALVGGLLTTIPLYI